MVASNTPGLRATGTRNLWPDDGLDVNQGMPVFDPGAGIGSDAVGRADDAPNPAGDAFAETSLSYASGGGAGTAKTTTFTTSTATAVASAFTIAISWDASVSSAPAGFQADVLAAAAYLQGQFTDAVTLNINVGYGEAGGIAIGSALGANLTNATMVGYSALTAALSADAKSATDLNVVASLPATTPIAGATYWVTNAQAKALGLATSGGVDASIGFGPSSLFTYGATATSGTIAAGTYDFFATAVHELTEVMGRRMFTGTSQGGYAGSYTLMDLLHYSSNGVRDLSATTAGYLSIDGGKTSLGALNISTGGDAGDWSSAVANDPFDAFASSGVLERVSTNDLTAMDALGWNFASAPPPASTSQPLGVNATPVTASLGALQGTSGLSGKAAMATFTQTGGATADTYTFILGGTGASNFAIATAGNVGTLSSGASSVAGAAGGKLYALTVTAKDTSSGKSTTAAAIDVVVGGGSADTIKLSSISGIVAAAPTFIYGLAGADSIDATGMTGSVYMAGGAGADTFTGGTGANRYMYSAAADSAVSAADIVKNFNVALDMIDLTGLGGKLPALGALASTATTIAAGSIGWQTATVGGAAHTMVYVNTSTASEALTAANMKIDLVGNIGLTSANFAHF